jgi:hypothetical protein
MTCDQIINEKNISVTTPKDEFATSIVTDNKIYIVNKSDQKDIIL